MQKLTVSKTKSKSGCCGRCLLGTCVYIFVLILLLFLVVFVIAPMAFKYSVGLQQSLIFPTFVIDPKNYSKIDQYQISGVRNLYIEVPDTNANKNITLGVWQVLPEEMLSDIIDNEDYNFDGVLANKNYNILIYLHGNGADRTGSIGLYEILRKYFHIFAIDYRGYADSSKGEMREDLIVDDIMYVYKWLKERSDSKVFVWGHSLGTGVATHLIANLKAQNNSIPSGLILEAPFTSVTDVMKAHPIIRVYSYLPWSKATILDPIVNNGLDFNSKKYIADVDCPIMILHAKDDDIIPVEFGTMLYNTAVNDRNTTYQGNVTFHLYEALGYNHMNIYKAPELAGQVSDFLKECVRFEEDKREL